jgi:hypothetical protein
MPAATPRGALPYPLGSDPPDTDGDLRKLAERLAAVGALYGQGPATDRPAATADRVGRFYWSTDGAALFYCTGAAWVQVNATTTVTVGGGVTPSSSRPADPAAEGSSGTAARADHVHGREPRYARHFLTMGA